ncbi:MAG: hypothetical protein WAO21_11815 [Verrucomicrobiia bacterium]
MLTAKTQYNLTNAREYFEEHLSVGDYYYQGQRVAGDLKPYGEHQQLRLIFVTHEVSVRGDSLERIETIMQRKQLSLLKTLPSHQWSLIEQGQPFVTEIVVAEKKDLSKRVENGQE